MESNTQTHTYSSMSVPERSRTLHNFSLPPRLNWGTQKLLRCAKLNNTHVVVSRKRRTSSPTSLQNDAFPQHDNQIHAIREKLMLDLRSEVDKFRAAFLATPPPPPPPWNLRTRRSPLTVESLPSPEVTVADGVNGGERPKFSVALSRQEIEDDFVAIVGRKPPRKPKKRPRYIQKQLDTLFPGLWLSEITVDMYRVDENPDNPK